MFATSTPTGSGAASASNITDENAETDVEGEIESSCDETDQDEAPTEADIMNVTVELVFNELPSHLIYISDDYETTTLFDRETLVDLIRPELIRACKDVPKDKLPDVVRQKLKYAALSHRWLSVGEPTFQEMSVEGNRSTRPGFIKLRNFCQKAREYGCRLAWSDTCCINKSSSAELDEAIRAMFKWYRNAEICIVFLADSSSMSDFPEEVWFQRGWTLQELLAPPRIKFYGKHWDELSCSRNDKEDHSMLEALSQVTGISRWNLLYFSPGLVDVREKMIWASKRRTTRVEDNAYSLIGILNISLNVAYGEGERAFRRLMEVIMQTCREWQIFAWAGPHSPSQAGIPSSPLAYCAFDEASASILSPDYRIMDRPSKLGDPFFTMTKRGLELEVILVKLMLQQPTPRRPGGKRKKTQAIRLVSDSANFHDVTARCDITFLPFSQWAVAIVNYQADESGKRGGIGKLKSTNDYLCFVLGSSIHSAYGGWQKVETQKIVIIRTKREVYQQVTTVWL
ncbi:heterokaryon incompatibility protein-domain-containing protein [Suillus clintonianus]|uniref:heterokaryon incompatibility protein-domain-containing protein n=1 Tax=Suillus clintonianus TaxID=1904413 RepID=UPI001B863748|nr:heterokaryon incompatibility protein-domain-containing protein [Suillus clintonianus]KAG2119454.1 heterokaryon incompatibility protein-domain-containing protein [Suillus clintonianus]